MEILLRNILQSKSCPSKKINNHIIQYIFKETYFYYFINIKNILNHKKIDKNMHKQQIKILIYFYRLNYHRTCRYDQKAIKSFLLFLWCSLFFLSSIFLSSCSDWCFICSNSNRCIESLFAVMLSRSQCSILF